MAVRSPSSPETSAAAGTPSCPDAATGPAPGISLVVPEFALPGPEPLVDAVSNELMATSIEFSRWSTSYYDGVGRITCHNTGPSMASALFLSLSRQLQASTSAMLTGFDRAM